MYYDGTASKFKWLTEGKYSNYTNFEDGSSFLETGYACAQLNSAGKWKPTFCDVMNVASCQVYGASKPISSRCPNGYDYWLGACYKLHMRNATHDEAEDICERHEGTDLVFINTELENSMLQDKLESAGAKNAWIGLRHVPCKDQYLWTSGGRGNGKLRPWAEGSPNTNTTCVGFVSDSGQWASTDCSEQQPFFCKVKP